MSRPVFEIHRAWPWVRRHVPKIVEVDPSIFSKQWVRLPDGRIGVVHHHKIDGKIAVRPVNEETFEFYPNTSEHWTEEQRKAIPEEIAIHYSQVFPIKAP